MRDGLIERILRRLIRWLARRLPDCKRMTRKLGESLDRTPTWRENLVMKLHLFTCDACARYMQQVEFLKHAVHLHGNDHEDSGQASRVILADDARERILALITSSVGLAISI